MLWDFGWCLSFNISLAIISFNVLFTVLCLEHILLKSYKRHAAGWQRPIYATPHSPLISTLVLSYSLFCVSVWLNGSWHCLFNCLRQKIGIVYDTSLTLHIKSTIKSYPFMSPLLVLRFIHHYFSFWII